MDQRKVLLVGGGHAHALLLHGLGSKPLPQGHSFTMVSDERYAPYSGMLPGYVGKTYQVDDFRIDLRLLCERAGVAFIEKPLVALSAANRQVSLLGGEDLSFDLLSVNTGAQPHIPEACAPLPCIGLKPLSRIIEALTWLDAKVLSGALDRIAVVGGGPGGAEFVLALRRRYGPSLSLALLSSDDVLLRGYPHSAQTTIRAVLARAGIHVLLQASVEAATPHSLLCRNGLEVVCGLAFFATGAVAPHWLKDSGLSLSRTGFLAINEHLQSLSNPFVFGTGDVTEFVRKPLAKAGVFAVRQAPILSHNIFAALRAAPLKVFRPQSRMLSILNTQDGKALMCWGGLSYHSRFSWAIKDAIDQRFMKHVKG